MRKARVASWRSHRGFGGGQQSEGRAGTLLAELDRRPVASEPLGDVGEEAAARTICLGILRGGGDSVSVRGVCEFGVLDGSQESLRSSTFTTGIPGRW